MLRKYRKMGVGRRFRANQYLIAGFRFRQGGHWLRALACGLQGGLMAPGLAWGMLRGPR